MAIGVIGKIVQRNNMTFKLMDAKNVSYNGDESISVKDKVDDVINKVDTKPDIVISDTEPVIKKTGDIWIESI